MDALPREVYLEVFTHLPHRDLLSVSKTCRTFAYLVKPLLFSFLSFDGQSQRTSPYWSPRTPFQAPDYGRLKTVDVRYLDAAVDEVISLGIAPLVKTFKFTPAQLIDEGFWRKYRIWVQDQIDEDIDPEDTGSIATEELDDLADGFDEEWYEMRIDRIMKRRETRLEREAELIERGEEIWKERIGAQYAAEDAGKAAMTRLFREMTNLRRIEVGTWSLDLREFGFVDEHDCLDNEVHEQFWKEELVRNNCRLVGTCLHAAGKRIKELQLPLLSPLDFAFTTGMQELFIGLEDLTMTFERHHNEPMLGTCWHVFAELMQHAQQTLKRLHLTFEWVIHRVDTLRHLLYLRRGEEEDEWEPLIFPKLKDLHLSGLNMSRRTLPDFLSAQPALEVLELKRIQPYDTKPPWEGVARSLPTSMKAWYIDDCFVHGSSDYQSHLGKFFPYKYPLPEHTGWVVKDPFNEADRDPKLWINTDGLGWRMRDRLEGAYPCSQEQRNARLTEEFKQNLTKAAFVRVGTIIPQHTAPSIETGEAAQAVHAARVPTALDDYQAQIRLLEEHNKDRLWIQPS